MEVALCDDIRKFDENEYTFIIIPCHWKGLAVKKSNRAQYGKCPVCDKDIYALPNGCVGHMR